MRTGDAIALFSYAVAMLVIGWWTGRRIRGTEGYFVGRRSLPGFAVGLSLVGTAISSVTFLAYPGSSYEGNWSRLMPGLMLPVAALVAVRFFVVFYRRTHFVSAYEYFGRRFGSWAQSYTSAFFSLSSIYRMGIILFLLCLPIRALTGWDLPTSILVVGAVVTFYTVLGGLEAVIWTDVVQTVILIAGGLVTALLVGLRVPGGFGQVLREASAGHKFDLVISFDFSLARETFWMFALSGIVGNVQEFSTDQTKIQRYLAARSDRAAIGATWAVGLGCLPIWSLFMFVGTCLWVYYRHFPERLVAGLKADEVYPRFILGEMPEGMGGLVMAALLAAAMSSIDSSMNGAATVLTVDFYKRFWRKKAPDLHYLRVARGLSLGLGLLMAGVAYLLSKIPAKTILDIGFFIGAVMAGGIGGLFLLGFLCPWANRQGAAAGVACGVTMIVWCTLSQLGAFPVCLACRAHPFVINVIGNATVLGVGALVSLAFPRPAREEIEGVTWWTRIRSQEPHRTEE
ncbi:MAG: sodium/solute symporter [candidate division KSB1 bacterium]|nr:sodium/solute symporter [candidate division KSB1 bacterium]